MTDNYIIKADKIITVSHHDIIYDGGMVVEKGKIKDIGEWNIIKEKYPHLKTINYENKVITPSLVDCHTHLLEFATSLLYPTVTESTHLLAGKAVLLHALSCGITALGEQICGHPKLNLTVEDYKSSIKDIPMNISFAATSISIGLKNLPHFTSVTGSTPVTYEMLLDEDVLNKISNSSEYPGENIFINATPANLKEENVPRAGEIIYTLEELKKIVKVYHDKNKKIGVHVAGEAAINMALEANVDVLHHAHGITEEQIKKAKAKGIMIVATPIGGTHLTPNSPSEIASIALQGIPIAVATDSYLPPSPKATWLPFIDENERGPEVLMLLANPSMKILYDAGWSENEILALITLNAAKVLQKDHLFGSLEVGKYANFIVLEGVPGLEIIDIEKIEQVYFNGIKVVNRVP